MTTTHDPARLALMQRAYRAQARNAAATAEPPPTVATPAARAASLEKRLPRNVFTKDAKFGESNDRYVTFVLSTEHVDRMGDIIRVAGWDTSDYNGVVLWGHDRRSMPIGYMDKTWVERVNGEPAFVGRVLFPEDDMHAEEVHSKLENGLLRSVSVGFLPLKVDPVVDQKERTKLGLGPYGVVFERHALLELSVVTIPANPHANRLRDVGELVERGLITRAEAGQALEIMGREPEEPSERDVGLTKEDGAAIMATLKALGTSIEHLSRAGAPVVPAAPASREPAVRNDQEADLYRRVLEGIQRTRSALHGSSSGVRPVPSAVP